MSKALTRIEVTAVVEATAEAVGVDTGLMTGDDFEALVDRVIELIEGGE